MLIESTAASSRSPDHLDAANIPPAPISHLLQAANQHFQAGDLATAAAACRAALAVNEGTVEALTLLGSIATLSGSPGDAIPLLRLANAVAPNDVRPLNALGVAYRKARKFAEARTCFETLIGRDPDRVEVLRNLAHTLGEQKEWTKSVTIFDRLFARGGGLPKDWIAYANALFELKRYKDAIPILRQCLITSPGSAEAWFNIGQVLYGDRMAGKAMAAFRHSVRCDPRKMMAYTNMSAIAHRHSNAALAAEISRQCLAVDPNYTPIMVNYGLALGSLGKTEEAIDAFTKVVRKAPHAHQARSNNIFFHFYRDKTTTRDLYELHREWNALHARRLRPAAPQFANVRDPAKRLRIGYASPDFFTHSCMLFLTSLYKEHDHGQVEVFSYSNTEREDGITDWVRERSDVWRDTTKMDDAEVAEQIRADGIDILVDLAGHTGRNRLLTFARKPAPIQVTWLGYPGTTGLDAIDYRLSDPWLTPEGTPEMFSEQIFNMPRVSHCFTPPEAPEVNPLPALHHKMITFGSFNHFTKISDQTVELWAALLKRVENARLLLKSRYIDSREVRDHLYSRFAEAGADIKRIGLISGSAQRDEHLAAYHQLDVAVDTTPYGGMTTSCEALWMGVPVLTLAGDRTCGRYGVSVLTACGLDGMIATTPEQFVETAARLEADRQGLAAVRAGMRDRMLRSPLCDEAGFTRALEAAYREMWTRWCQSA